MSNDIIRLCKKCLKNYTALSDYNIRKHEKACFMRSFPNNPKISTFFAPKIPSILK